ncbi:bifunctional folylpolyglutamate synthase/dihydrofolate synthase [Anaerosporobacter sp.]|uniref:bifunctional folylpolyglutamate synthase/dihydrofolate synthase n=1 Tax=Anaerosporobacter sp. TaxID=1872529 RepID=UPI00286F2CBE|nr:folylpolyglutamate synthase/dihydrofolate synthase family protein [Anaerosporobacter sp.]
MNYIEAIKYIDEIGMLGSVLGLESTTELLNRLGNPQDKLQFVHIAGTNGKGSTAAYIANIMALAGYRIGRYISPTIRCYCERIQITDKTELSKTKTTYITEEAVARHLTTIADVCNAMAADGKAHPTPFEIETVMSFLEFVEQGCDLVVLEVGMGGRLDATNVIKNTQVAVLASISMDHMQFLGDTLAQIAYEKAGIVKNGCKVVSYQQQPEAMEVIKTVCEEKDAELVITNFESIQHEEYHVDGTKFDFVIDKDNEWRQLEIRLLGKMQVKNAAVAIRTVLMLKALGYAVTKENIYTGLKETGWNGRFEKIHDNPMIILDGAHNEDAAYALKEAMDLYFKDKECIYVMGVLADKEYEKVLKIVADKAKAIYTITPNNIRGLKAESLAACAMQYCDNVRATDSVKQALQLAIEDAQKDRMQEEETPIIVFGSLSFHEEVYLAL